MLLVLETPRLLLRPMRPSDTEAFFAFGSDPDAMRYTHCHTSLHECRRRLAAFEWQRRKRGYAPWAVTTKADGRLVGWGGVYVDPFDPQWGPELGYSFHPDAWERVSPRSWPARAWNWLIRCWSCLTCRPSRTRTTPHRAACSTRWASCRSAPCRRWIGSFTAALAAKRRPERRARRSPLAQFHPTLQAGRRLCGGRQRRCGWN